MIHFVGAGPGAVDLITVRGKTLLETADQIIYAGSLVNPELLTYAKKDCVILDSAAMTLEDVIAAMETAEKLGWMTVRLHTGDPSVYGAIREQMDILTEKTSPSTSSPASVRSAVPLPPSRPNTPCPASASRSSLPAWKGGHPFPIGRKSPTTPLIRRRWSSSSAHPS